MMDIEEFKKFFLFNLIGALVISALVAIVTVLIGSFNEISGRVLFTLAMVIMHSLVSLSFIWENEKKHTFENLSFFTNTLFFIIVLSFLTSILGIWKIIPGDFIWNIYQTFFVIGFASLHGNILSKALHKETYIDTIIYLNYLFMAGVVLMLLPIIYIENAVQVFGEFYYRVLGAIGIVDGTLSILTIIFHKIYMHKHPKAENPLYTDWHNQAPKQAEKKRGLSMWVWILIIYLILQIALPLLFFIFRMISLSDF